MSDNPPTGDAVVEKTPKQLEKEAAKQAKLDKFKAKQAKAAEQQQKSSATGDNAESAGKKAAGKGEKKVAVYEGKTQPGEKKDLSQFPESYSPGYVEAAWYAWWEKQGMFKPEYHGRDIYSEENKPCENTFMMVIPPPNVTGSLHIGHALTSAIEDTLTRWHRMCGHTTLWVPGCDHAGIATQVVVEKKLKRERGVSRHDIGREAFVAEVWKWKNEKGHTIYDQIRALGSSVDWDRVAFTMDDKLVKAVTEAFVRLHQEGLIYRDNRLVNWSCTLKSAISDIEVDKRELTGRTLLQVPGYSDKVEFGVLVSFAYPLVDDEGSATGDEIVVATTRVETMLADSAVAVHPEDPRYKAIHGKFVRHPIRGDRMPVVTDDFVEQSFGSGAVKITPAHDHNDFMVGKRHDLPFLQMLDEDGNVRLTDENDAPLECKFNGMKRFDARKAITQELTTLRLYKGTQDHTMVVPVCSRSKDVVEPILKPQWYLGCDQMAEDAIKVVADGRIKFFPESHVRIWQSWLEKIRPWCISRQLWWGHRIPAYYVTLKPDKVPDGLDKNIRDNPDLWISGRTVEEATENTCKKFGVTKEEFTLTQDEDVLDTWFSSGLFPFSVFGWPDSTQDLARFYPGAMLETGHDIMFFWVARMVFMGQKLLGDIPFKEVLFHSIVRDAHGRKISKSFGNVVDPVDVINGISLESLQRQLNANTNLDANELARASEGQKRDFPNGIPECGTDALRFALCAYSAQGKDINLDVLRIQGYRFFCNKIWNAVRLSFDLLGENYTQPDSLSDVLKLSRDSGDVISQWALSRLSLAADVCNEGLSTYMFPTATTAIHQFCIYEFCDLFLEHIKPVIRDSNSPELTRACRAVLYTCVDTILKLLAPLMPFITEDLWQRLPKPANAAPSIHVSAYPTKNKFAVLRDSGVEVEQEMAFAIVREVRSTRANYDLQKKLKLQVYLTDMSSTNEKSMSAFLPFITALTVSHVTLSTSQELPRGCAACVLPFAKVNILLMGVIDKDKELEKLSAKQLYKQSALAKLSEQAKLPDYSEKVPLAVQQKNQEKVEELTKELSDIETAISTLRIMDLS